jgi:hypothetical protein
MGCDIHAYIDYDSFVQSDTKPYTDCFAELHLGRDYNLFNEMASVRGNGGLFSPRGLPEHISWRVDWENTLYVITGPFEEEGCCTREKAEKWVARGYSKWADDGHTKVTHPDWHSHSYLYLDEVKQVYKALGYPHDELKAVIAAMKALNGKNPERSRLVFWFDN